MLVAYGFGIILIYGPWPQLDDAFSSHFVVAVAISGSFSPQMYMHLVEARDDNVFTASRTLSSLRVASFASPEVSLASPFAERSITRTRSLAVEQ